MRKLTICIGENKGADQLRSASVTVQVGLHQTWSETQIIGFLT